MNILSCRVQNWSPHVNLRRRDDPIKAPRDPREEPQRGFTVREVRLWNPGGVRRRGGAFPTQRSPPGGGQHWAMGWNRFAVRWHMTSPGKHGPLAKPGTSCEHYWFASVTAASLLVRYRPVVHEVSNPNGVSQFERLGCGTPVGFVGGGALSLPSVARLAAVNTGLWDGTASRFAGT